MGELLAFLRLAREIREVVLEIGKLIDAGRAEEAAEAARAASHGRAAGKAAYEASRRAGKVARQ